MEEKHSGQPGAAPTLKEEMHAAETQLTDAERAALKTKQQELIGKFMIIGCLWGIVLGAVINKFLLGGTAMDGIYTGIVVGLVLGVGAGVIFGALEKAMLLQRVGKYARPAAAQTESAAEAAPAAPAETAAPEAHTPEA